jgi:biopolymer transport protein ExbB
MRVLLTLLLLASLARAEEDVAAQAAAARAQAEQALKEGRARILGERAELARQLAEAYRKLDEARADAAAATSSRMGAEDSLRRVRAASSSEAQSLRGAVAQLYVAAGLVPPASSPDDAALEHVAAGIAARAQRLPASLEARLGEEEILDRDGVPVRSPVLHVGPAAVALGADARVAGLLMPTISGRGMVAGDPLPRGALDPHALPPTGLIAVPLDVDGSLARPHASGGGFTGWFASGGPFMWAILAVGVAGLALMAERTWWFARARLPAAEAEKLRAAALRGEAVTAARRPLERVLAAGRDSGALERALLAEEPALERSLSLLAALAACAPLLGLLGTVTGMIGMFATLAEHGSGNPRLLSSHISVALVTTQFGLMVAVPLLIGHAWFARLRERLAALLEEAAVGVAEPRPGAPAPGRYDTELERVRP